METVKVAAVTGNFFPVLGLDPAIGRLFGPADEPAAITAPAVAVMSWSWWKNRFTSIPPFCLPSEPVASIRPALCATNAVQLTH